MKKVNNLQYLVLLIIILSIFNLDLFYPKRHDSISLLVTTLTLALLAIYTYDTRRLANQSETEQIRPIILREGIFDWEVSSIQKMKQQLATFNLVLINIKNVALNIEGHIVMHNKKYRLFFANEISVQTSNLVSTIDMSKKVINVQIFEKWRWLPENARLLVTIDETKYEDSAEENVLEVSYSDIEGNKFIFRESCDFEQKNIRV